MLLQDGVTALPKIGSKQKDNLRRLGVETIGDLLQHFPVRYEDWSQITAIKDLAADEPATIRARVQQLRSRRAWRRRGFSVTEGLLADASGVVRVVWFNQPYIAKNLVVGEEYFFSGRPRAEVVGLQLAAPQYERVKTAAEQLHTARLVPIYASTQGITQKLWRFWIDQAEKIVGEVADWVPSGLAPDKISLSAAWRKMHFPADGDDVAVAKKFFDWREAFLWQLSRERNRLVAAAGGGVAVPLRVAAVKKFVSGLPFVLTADQKRAAYAILQDMEKSAPMNRLVQGDVGSGKTVVAAVAAYNNFVNGHQTVLLAPTQLLAEQHAATLEKILAAAGVPVILFTRTQKNKIPATPAMIVGTHALLTEKIKFTKLGLVVVDEQHRFGVAQRRALKEKNSVSGAPHFLSLTATPIPRSLTLTIFGDLAVSRIKTMPLGRKPIITKVVTENNRTKAREFVTKHLARGEQMFVVAPLIDPSDFLGVEAVTEVFGRVQKEFPAQKVLLLHGRTPTKERAQIMADMHAGDAQILVATPVIEVGVDLPAATVMWIESAERFGLAQLHQLRGRVGRSDRQSFCFLFSPSRGEKARERLGFMEKINDGFLLAERDLAMRGAGEILGTLQSGLGDWEKLQAIDLPTWQSATAAAQEILAADLSLEKHPALQEKLNTWESAWHRE